MMQSEALNPEVRRIRRVYWGGGVTALGLLLLGITALPSPIGGSILLAGMILMGISAIVGARSVLAKNRAKIRAASSDSSDRILQSKDPRQATLIRGVASPRLLKFEMSMRVIAVVFGFVSSLIGVALFYTEGAPLAVGYVLGGAFLFLSFMNAYIIVRKDHPDAGRPGMKYFFGNHGAGIFDSGEAGRRPEGDEFELSGVDLLAREAPARPDVADAVSALMSRQLAAVTTRGSSGYGSASNPGPHDLQLSQRTRGRLAATEVLFLGDPEGHAAHRVAFVPHGAVSSWVQDVVDQWAEHSAGTSANSVAQRSSQAVMIPRQYAVIDVAELIKGAADSLENREPGSGLSPSVTVRVMVTQGILIATDIWIGDEPGQKLFSPDIPQQCVDALSQA